MLEGREKKNKFTHFILSFPSKFIVARSHLSTSHPTTWISQEKFFLLYFSNIKFNIYNNIIVQELLPHFMDAEAEALEAAATVQSSHR